MKKLNIKSVSDLTETDLYKAAEKIIRSFKFIEEVKTMNATSFVAQEAFQTKCFLTYRIDTEEPYKVNAPHKGISRVLQSFEVVLLTILVYEALHCRAIPVSLEHDRILIMMPKNFIADLKFDLKEIAQLFQSSGRFREWSRYLLKSRGWWLMVRYQSSNF